MNVITHLTCGDIIFVHIDLFIFPDLWGHDHDMNVITYRVYKKNATSEFPKKSTLFWRQKILGAWEFKIAQLSKLLHTRVHLFNAQQQ
jgi:hypothetical protein